MLNTTQSGSQGWHRQAPPAPPSQGGGPGHPSMGEVEGAKPPQNPTTTGVAPKNHKFDTEGCTRFGPGFEKLMLSIIGAFQLMLAKTLHGV